MIRLEHALAAGALACAAVAVAVPTRFDVVEIEAGDRPGVVLLDGDRVTVHAPDVGYRLDRTLHQGDEAVILEYEHVAGNGAPVFVAFAQVRDTAVTEGERVGERDGRPIRLVTDTGRTTGVGWEVVDDAVVIVTSIPDNLELVLEVIDELEIDP